VLRVYLCVLTQPYRGKAMPILFPMIQAAITAGAAAGFLSGAGPSVLAISQGSPAAASGTAVSGTAVNGTAAGAGTAAAAATGAVTDAVAAAMLAVARGAAVTGDVIKTRPVAVGAQVRWGRALAASRDIASPWHVCVVCRVALVVWLCVPLCVRSRVSSRQVVSVTGPAMRYRSTRDTDAVLRSFEYVAMQGLAADGGLFVPEYVRASLIPSSLPPCPPVLAPLPPSLDPTIIFFIGRRFRSITDGRPAVL
jgi:hypothetical protein